MLTFLENTNGGAYYTDLFAKILFNFTFNPILLLKMGYIALLYRKEAKSANLVVRDYKALHKTGSNSM